MSVNSSQDANSKDYRILIVDDEKPVLEVMTEILQSAGWTVDAFFSPVAALKKIKHVRFDTLLLDLYMPEMPGLLFHAKLRVLDRQLFDRTIFISGHFNSQDLKKALEGTPRFVPKPFRAEALVSAVSNAMAATPRAKAAGHDPMGVGSGGPSSQTS